LIKGQKELALHPSDCSSICSRPYQKEKWGLPTFSILHYT
jgi:hypothetical protein